MILRLVLPETQKEVRWDDLDILSFHKLISYQGKKYEWLYYDADTANVVDHILYFKEIKPGNTMYSFPGKDWDELKAFSKYDSITPDSTCTHDWKQYFGLQQTFDYCTKCGEKRK